MNRLDLKMANRYFALAYLGYIILVATFVLAAPPKRISAKILDLGKVHRIYMVPGMATLIEIPTAVTGIRVGNPEAVVYFRPDKPENEVTLVLKDANAKPTNLIIRSNHRKFIFDIIPSKNTHQDSIEVQGSFGGAIYEEGSPELIESSHTELAKKARISK